MFSCDVDDCEKPAREGGLCPMHYQRLRKYGSVDTIHKKGKRIVPCKVSIISPTDLSWLAGLLEGEGCFATTRNRPAVLLNMCDEDIVQRASNIISKLTNKSHIVYENDYAKRNKGHSLIYQLRIHGEAASVLMKTILPLMGERRTQCIEAILEGRVIEPISGEALLKEAGL